jgi:hypothetical protein
MTQDVITAGVYISLVMYVATVRVHCCLFSFAVCEVTRREVEANSTC